MAIFEFKKFKEFVRTAFILLFGVSVCFVIFEGALKSLFLQIVEKHGPLDVNVLFNALLYVFIFCSVALVSIIYWLAKDNKKLRTLYTHYVSQLVAKDYYKDTKAVDYDRVIDGLTKYPQRGTENDDNNREDTIDVVPTITKVINKPEKVVVYEDDKGNAIHRLFYRNGQLKEETPYFKGILHGQYRLFYEDGRIHQEKLFENGKLNGSFRSFDENGILFFEIQYKNDKQHGIDKIYYKNGTVQYEDTYVEGVRVNRKTYTEQGELKFDQDF